MFEAISAHNHTSMLRIAALLLFALVPINIVFIVKCYAWVLRLQLGNLIIVLVDFIAVEELDSALFGSRRTFITKQASLASTWIHYLTILHLLLLDLLKSSHAAHLSPFTLLISSPLFDKSLLVLRNTSSDHFGLEHADRLDHLFEFEEHGTLDVCEFLIAEVQASVLSGRVHQTVSD